jgi:four helix bundle protein
MKKSERNTIRSFKDLEIFQNSYRASIMVMKVIVPSLPKIEEYDLKSQISRSCKAITRLIAEGYAKRHQIRGFQKYLDDSMAESNEMIVNLSHCKDLYSELVDSKICEELIDVYDKTGRQIYKLSMSWKNFHNKNNRTP